MRIEQANVVELAANAERTSTLTATGVDVKDYDGTVQVVLMSTAATAGTTPALNVKIQHSDESGANYTDVTGATFAEVTDAGDVTEMISLKIGELKRYIRVVGTITGTSTPTFAFGVCMVGCLHAGRNASQAI